MATCRPEPVLFRNGVCSRNATTKKRQDPHSKNMPQQMPFFCCVKISETSCKNDGIKVKTCPRVYWDGCFSGSTSFCATHSQKPRKVIRDALNQIIERQTSIEERERDKERERENHA